MEELILKGASFQTEKEYTDIDIDEYRKNFGILLVRNPQKAPEGETVGTIMVFRTSASGFYTQVWFSPSMSIYIRILTNIQIRNWVKLN